MKQHLHGKVVDLGDVIDGRAAAEQLQGTVATAEDLAAFDPAHAAYVYTQNQVSVMSEQLTALKEMAPFADIIAKAEDLYMPGGPPMSPLTGSYLSTPGLERPTRPSAPPFWNSALSSACTPSCCASSG